MHCSLGARFLMHFLSARGCYSKSFLHTAFNVIGQYNLKYGCDQGITLYEAYVVSYGTCLLHPSY